jgi:hypothetical protein
MKTWIAEIAVVWLVLIGVVGLTRGGLLEAVGALAVLAAFAHAQVAERMREREAARSKPDVHCHRWLTRYFLAKELLWLSYFVAHRSWSAIAGVGVFLLYPLWRKWWRARHPISSRPFDRSRPPVVSIFGKAFALRGTPALHLGEPGRSSWRASCRVEIAALHGDCIFLKEQQEAGEAVPFYIENGGRSGWYGQAHLTNVFFYEDPYDHRTLASFDAFGEGELHNV